MSERQKFLWMREVAASALLFLPAIFASRKNRLRFLSVLLFLTADVLLAAWIPYCGKLFVESVSGTVKDGIFVTLSLWSFLWLFEKLTRPLQDLLFFPIINETIRNLSFRVVEKIHSLPWTLARREGVGEVISRVKRISQSARFFFRTCCLGFLPIFCKMLLLIFFLLHQPGYAGAVVVCLVLYFGTLQRGLKKYLSIRNRAWEMTDHVTETVHHSLLNTHVARFFRVHEMKKIGAELDQEAQCWHAANRAQNLFQIQVSLAMAFSLLGLSLIGIAFVQGGRMSVGDFVWIQGQCVALFYPMKLLSIEFRQFQEAVVDIQEVRELLERVPEGFLSSREIQKRESPVPIFFDRITFSYPGQKPLFKDLSWELGEGERVVLSGPSGVGKTTCALLMTGMFFPTEGKIRVFGKSTQRWEAEELRPFVQRLSLQGGIFPGTFRENLLYGTERSPKAIWKVITRVGLEEVVENMDSLDQPLPLGDLSQGERARFLLGRTLLNPPRVLILDELLHAVEPEEEIRLLKMMADSVPTLLYISHRLPEEGFFDRKWQVRDQGIHEWPEGFSTVRPA